MLPMHFESFEEFLNFTTNDCKCIVMQVRGRRCSVSTTATSRD